MIGALKKLSASIKPRIGARLIAGDPINTALRAYWPMTECGGLSLFDIATNNFGAVTGNWRTTGAFGPCLNFNGSSGEVNCGASSLLKPTNFVSVSCWANSGGSQANFAGLMVGPLTAGLAGGYLLVAIAASQKVRFYIDQNGAGSFAFAEANAAIGAGWHHYCGTYDGATVRLYVDGVLQTTTAAATAPVYGTTAINFKIGNYGGNLWVGQIDNARVFARGLRGGEVQRLYREPFAGVSYPQSIAFKTSGIAFDAASNSGDIAAASSYSGNASWSGSNRMLAVDVCMLGPGVTVTAMTYGGATCTLVGVRSTVTSFGRVEQWRICSSDSGAPAAGSNTLSVTLSGSLEFAVDWTSYTGVHQTSPTEGFNSNQATNVGATDATVTVTSVADNCWIHAACVASDTSITAGQTSRNNVSGTLGSGANEDNGAAVTPPGGTAMNYTGVGAAVTWAIAGYAIRPIAASSGGGNSIIWLINSIMNGLGSGGPFFHNPLG